MEGLKVNSLRQNKSPIGTSFYHRDTELAKRKEDKDDR